MLLRLLLVGAVTGLGLDLPSRGDVDRWAAASQAWWNAQVAAVARMMPQTEGPIEEVDAEDAEAASLLADVPMPDGADAFATEMASPVPAEESVAIEQRADVEFEAIVDAMADSFVPQAPVVHVERFEGGDELYPGVAYALNQAAENAGPAPKSGELIASDVDLPESPFLDLPATASVEPALTEPAPDVELPATPVTPLAGQEVAATPAHRFETAVKLTGKAVEAWVALLQTPAVLSTEH